MLSYSGFSVGGSLSDERELGRQSHGGAVYPSYFATNRPAHVCSEVGRKDVKLSLAPLS